MALVAAAVWALRKQKLRNTTIVAGTLTLSFWMTLMAAVVLSVLSVMSIAFERHFWTVPSAKTWLAIVYNGVLIFGFTHTAWFTLARGLPPIASTLSTMMISVLGVFSAALAGRGAALARLGGSGVDGSGYIYRVDTRRAQSCLMKRWRR